MPLEPPGNSCQVPNNPILLSLKCFQADTARVELKNGSVLSW